MLATTEFPGSAQPPDTYLAGQEALMVDSHLKWVHSLGMSP